MRNTLRAAALVSGATALTAGLLGGVLLPAAPAAADTGQCTFGGAAYKGRPWALQRVNLDELWQESTGKNARVAVIDTGVDIKNPQLAKAVDVRSGANYLPKKNTKGEKIEDRGNNTGTTDTVGHGTRVAGIIAARPDEKHTGFVGLAPDAKIIPIKQNDAEGNGTADLLADAIGHAVAEKADVINISQDTANAAEPTPKLRQAVEAALAKKIVVVASAGNDGLGGKAGRTYPASYPGVLAVAASDRNNERASFSQAGEWVGVAAPGVDMISTVPQGGHCPDNGTSFSAPYVAGVAALIKSKHKDWTSAQVVAQIEQTAERSAAQKDEFVGWGVVDPVAALTQDDHPVESPAPQEGVTRAKAPEVPPLHFGETADERNSRLGTYAAVGAIVAVVGLSGAAVAIRDARRRRT
ncbi:type VII secretion-associated serine protease mycosin [Streptomyces sp. SID5785]|uniref:type VII secretion-associated serine protease mycosin n=1 Tax=Streptomyces sp. SID5785 TaxID=2690309 RepID=UPI001360C4D2|nr:type VII secretion-associated serine protease mycosin [Streptomyces sp. SID5785]MZD10467.1 type VII secretion-associated serine protease mycosin [Streptomyces sp. SID5785]